MGLFSFIKDAGSNVFGNTAEASEDQTAAITTELAKYEIEGVTVVVTDGAVTLSGEVANKFVKRKAIVITGNINGIESVDDQMSYAIEESTEQETSEPAPKEDLSKQFHVVQAGDTLSKIAGEVYGNVMKYPIIFEANKPMLSDPDKIYPGQTLIIPSLDEE